MPDEAPKTVTTTGTLVDFRPGLSLYRGRATVLSDDPTVGRVQVDGTFLFPLPGARAQFSLEPVTRGKRQPTFRATDVAYLDDFDGRYALDTITAISAWGGRNPDERALREQLTGLAEKYGDQLADAIVDGSLSVDEALLSDLGAGLYRLRQALSLSDLLHREFLFDEQACYEVVNALAVRGHREDDLIDRLRANPYLLAGLKDVHLRWDTLEAMAARFGIAKDAPERIDGKIVHQFSDEERNGHTAIEQSILYSKLERGLLISPARIRYHVQQAIDDGRLKGVDFDNGMRAVTTPIFYSEEVEMVAHLARLAGGKSITQLTTALERRVHELGCEPDQEAAIIGGLTNPLAVITGGPGSGKSFVLGQIAKIALELGVDDQAVLGPTGRAALRTKQVLPAEIRPGTIHRALLANGIGFRRDHNNPIDTRMEMVDESGMLSNPLFLSLLRATPTVPLLLFGDPDQLPPIERGEPFRSMIDCARIPVFTLYGGRRYNAESREAIIRTAEACLAQNSGEFLSLLQEPEIRPFVTLVTPSTPDDEGIVETIVRGIRAGINAGKNLDDFQIVSKLNHRQQRTISTRVLHNAVTEAFVANDATRRSLRLSNGMIVREGERVMQSKNNDDINLMNGDIATVEHIAGRRVEIRVADTGAVIPLTPFQCQTLIGGFAGTPHKLQGGGFHTVVIPLSFDNHALLGHRALFTSMTRATNRIILVGTPHIAEQAVLYEDYPARITTFETTLKRDLPTIRPPVMQPELIIA